MTVEALGGSVFLVTSKKHSVEVSVERTGKGVKALSRWCPCTGHCEHERAVEDLVKKLEAGK